VRNPLFYAALVSILLLWRLGDWFAKKGRLATAKAGMDRASASAS
jgi:hypothetical protein